MRFRAKIWKTGNSLVITIPNRLEVADGMEFWVTLENISDIQYSNDKIRRTLSPTQTTKR